MTLIAPLLTFLKPDPKAPSGWAREMVTEPPKDVPVVDGWTSWDPTDPLFREKGVVIRS